MDAALVVRHPWLTLIAVVLVTIALGPAAASLTTDNDLATWLPKDDAERVTYERFRDRFGGDDFALVARLDGDEATLLDAVPTLAWDLVTLDGVRLVTTPLGTDADGNQAFLGDDPLRGSLVSRSGSDSVSVALLVALDPDLDGGGRHEVIDAIADTVVDARDGPWRVAGPVAINRALDVASRDSFSVLVPAAALGVALVLLLGLRSLRAALIVVAAAGLASFVSLGAVSLAGRSLHMVLSVLPAMLLVLGTAYALHPVSRFLHAPLIRGESVRSRWIRVLRRTFRPALVAAGTTAAGLGSLTFAGLPPVRDLGVFGALGVLVAFVLAYTFVPAAMILARVVPRQPAKHVVHGAVAKTLARIAYSRRGLMVAGWVVVIAAAGFGIARLRVESNVLRLMAPDTPVRVATEDVEARLQGLTPLEVWIEGPRNSVFSDETTAAADTLAEKIRDLPLVTHVLSPLNVQDTTPDDLARKFPPYVQVEDDRASVRMTICSRTGSTDAGDELAGRVKSLIPGTFPDDVDAVLTGSIPLLLRVQGALVTSQIRSFGAAFLLVSLVLLVDLRSASLAIVSLVPNLVPALAAAGAMGWLGVPLDAATVAVAGIAFGLAVDDTVHVIHEWVASRGDLESVLRATARPILLTTAAAVAGFGAFAASPFPPARRLGLLVAGAAAVALAADLFLLPALLSRLRVPERTRGKVS